MCGSVRRMPLLRQCWVFITVFVVACSSSTSPSPTPIALTPIDRLLTVRVTPRGAVRLAPDVLEARIQRFRPYSWAAGWIVTIEATELSQTRPVIVQSVQARIEAASRVLGQVVSRLDSQPLGAGAITVEQSLTYEPAVPPPSESRLVVTVRASDADGVTGEVSTAGNKIEERYCGGRAQGSCSGTFIAVRSDGTLLMEGNHWVGQKVYFFNGDNKPHALRCDPHPAHTGCDEFDQVNLGILEYSYSEVFNKAGTFGFHDEANPENPALRGRLTVNCCIF